MPGEAYVVFSDYELDIAESQVAFARAEQPTYGFRTRGSGWDCPDAWEFDMDGDDWDECGGRPMAKGRYRRRRDAMGDQLPDAGFTPALRVRDDAGPTEH